MSINHKKFGGGGSLYTTYQPTTKITKTTERRMLSDRGGILYHCCREAGGSLLNSVSRDVYVY